MWAGRWITLSSRLKQGVSRCLLSPQVKSSRTDFRNGCKGRQERKRKKSALPHFWYPCVLSEQRTFCQKRFLQHLSPSVRTELPRGLEIFPASRHRKSIYDHSSLPQICLTNSYLPFLLFEWKITERKQMESNKKLGGWSLRVGEANAQRKSDTSDGGFLLKPICGSLGQIKLSTRRRRESQDWVQSGEGLSGTSPELWLKEKIFVNAHINISR